MQSRQSFFYYSKKPFEVLENAVEQTLDGCPIPCCEMVVCVVGTPFALLATGFGLFADCARYAKQNNQDNLSEARAPMFQQMS